MEDKKVTRRKFMRDGAMVAAGVAVGFGAKTAGGATVNTSRILNYNQNMEYRRQGKTNLMVSAVCLGGHSRSNQKERTEIVSRAIDIGINYIDACTKGEVIRDAKALKGRRDKMYLSLSHCGKETRDPEYRTAKKLLESLDEVLLAAGEDYTDLWRITCYEPGGRHTFNTACEMVEALEKAKKQGKARFVGFSTHDRRWIKFMIEYFPQIECVCFPYHDEQKGPDRQCLRCPQEAGCRGFRHQTFRRRFVVYERPQNELRPCASCNPLYFAQQHRHSDSRIEQYRLRR